MLVCVICGKEIVSADEWDVHFFHDDNCPNHIHDFAPSPNEWINCFCDNPCHSICCPFCSSEDTKAGQAYRKCFEDEAMNKAYHEED